MAKHVDKHVPVGERTQPESIHQVPVQSLRPADSPRLGGEDTDHIRRLEESHDRLPPILVHRATMRVIDGMHRLRLAQQRNQDIIDVHFFDGSEQDAFVLAVRANVTHGLPLSLADREAAARRIVTSFPSWSDRMIASIAGLSAGTIRTIRQAVGAAVAGKDGDRVGRDGRRRPVNPAVGRLAAGRFVSEHPNASLRTIAREAGISLATARDVRERIRRGENPLTPVQRPDTSDAERARTMPRKERTSGRHRNVSGGARTTPTRDEGPGLEAMLYGLARDPALRFTDSGRTLLRWLSLRASDVDRWNDVAPAIPPHCTYIVADLARRCASEWLAFAEKVEGQAETMA